MRRYRFAHWLSARTIAFAVVPVTATAALAEPPLILTLQDPLPEQEVTQLLADRGLGGEVRILHRLPEGSRVLSLQLPPQTGLEWAIETLEADPRVKRARAAGTLRALSADPLSPQQWGLEQMGIDDA